MNKIDELKGCIVQVLLRTYADTNKLNIERYLKRKMLVVLKDILPIAVSGIRHTRYPDDDTVKLFASTKYRKSWGQMSLNSKQVDAPGLLTPILFDVLLEGHSSIGSAIRIKERTLDALMEYAIEESDDLQWVQTFDTSSKDVLETPVDVQSLRKYVKKLEFDGDLLKREKLRNLCRAKTILASLTTQSGPVIHGIQQPDIHILIQEAVIAPSGRMYLKGLNLQNCPKALRHAALGHCHLYDMCAGVFGVLAGIAKAHIKATLSQDKEFHHIKNYVLHRNEIRVRITNELWPNETKAFNDPWEYKKFYGFHQVKVALTAIGFGAKRNASASWKNANGNWEATSLRKTFKDKEIVEQFVELKAVKELMDEFKQVTDIILLKLKTNAAFAASFDIEGLKDSQKLSMVYQGTESIIMASFLGLIENSDILVPVHDGVYVSKRFDLADLHYNLKVPFGIDKSYIQFEHEQIGLAMPANFEFGHQQGIASEELAAQDYTPLPGTVSAVPFVAPKPQVMTPWGLIDADLLPAEVKTQDDYYFEPKA